ncbi:hypothetical protein [Paenibacillus dendritiformis]|uniref:hypothetical protein n=1 Tax=Paenibacillus dendritiformis TaxID=130049 RepID=UPI0011B74BB2|nr:hypothetical protein [Paenibacillus dendritiformis]
MNNENEQCPACGEVRNLVFMSWFYNPDPASGVETPGIFVCEECKEQAEEAWEKYDEKLHVGESVER